MPGRKTVAKEHAMLEINRCNIVDLEIEQHAM